MRTTKSTVVGCGLILACCLFDCNVQGKAEAGWRRSGSLPLIQTNALSATVVYPGESKAYGTFLSAGCLPDGPLIMMKVPTLAGPKSYAPIEYRITYAVDALARQHNITVSLDKPDEFVRVRGEDAKLFLKNIADGAKLNLVVESEATKLEAQFDISDFFEVGIPALSGCL